MMAHSFRGHGGFSSTPMIPHGSGPSSYRLPEMTQDTPRITFPGGWGEAGAHPGVELAFRDTAGHNWLRTSRGELKELGMSPIEYYDDMCYPYGSDILVRYEF